MLRPSTIALLTLACPLLLCPACDEPDEGGFDLEDGEDVRLRCDPVWDCLGGGQTPNSGGHDFNNIPYRSGHYGAINYKYLPGAGASVLYATGGACLINGSWRDIIAWYVEPKTGEIRAQVRLPPETSLFPIDFWLYGDDITTKKCTWTFAVYDYSDRTWSTAKMRFTNRQLSTVHGQPGNTYVMWTDVEPDVDGAFYSDGFYTACFENQDYRVLPIAKKTKEAERGRSTFANSEYDAVFECLHRSPIGEAFDHMGMHLNDMNDPEELMAVQNMMQGAGDRGFPTTNFNTYIAPVCDSGEHTTPPPSATHELEACWDQNGANCKGDDYRIENEPFPASFAAKPACTPALMTAAYCCSYVLK